MKVRTALMIIVAAALALSFAPNSALACGKAKCSELSSCETEKTEDGFRRTMKAKEEAGLAALREMVRSCAERSGKDGVYFGFEDVEGGIVMTVSATDPEVIKELHAKADACAGDRCGACSGCDCKHGCGGKHGCGSKHGFGSTGDEHSVPCCGKKAAVV